MRGGWGFRRLVGGGAISPGVGKRGAASAVVRRPRRRGARFPHVPPAHAEAPFFGWRSCSGGELVSGELGVVEGAVFEHGAGDGEEPVADGAEGASVGEAAGAEGAVAGLAEGVVLGGDAGPVIEGVSEFVLDGEAADLPAGVAGLDADGGDSGAGAERGVVAALEQGEGFGEESAEDVDPDSGQGEEDGGVVGALVVGVVPGRTPSAVRGCLDVPGRGVGWWCVPGRRGPGGLGRRPRRFRGRRRARGRAGSPAGFSRSVGGCRVF